MHPKKNYLKCCLLRAKIVLCTLIQFDLFGHLRRKFKLQKVVGNEASFPIIMSCCGFTKILSDLNPHF